MCAMLRQFNKYYPLERFHRQFFSNDLAQDLPMCFSARLQLSRHNHNNPMLPVRTLPTADGFDITATRSPGVRFSLSAPARVAQPFLQV